MIIIGISAFYHDSAVTIVQDGKIIFASQEERYTRVKHDSSFPAKSIIEALKYLNLDTRQVDAIVFFEKPFLKFERLLETYLAFVPNGFKSFLTSMPIWLKDKIFQKNEILNHLVDCGFSKETIKDKIYFSDHHLSHAASAFFPSSYEEALVLTMDGVGEWATTSVYIGRLNTLQKIKQINFPHSLGMLYSAFTYYCGFKVNSGEYKLMGLAPYGRPIFADQIKKHLIDIKPDGSFRLNMKYFSYCTDLVMTNNDFDKLFNHNLRSPEQELKQVHMDLAASVQNILEEVLLKICTDLKKKYNISHLCMAGGVALNCVANSVLLKSGLFKNIWIQPAAGDAGGSLGAALAYYYIYKGNNRLQNHASELHDVYLGQDYSDDKIEAELKLCDAIYEKLSDHQIVEHVGQQLVKDKAVGWFQGRMEFGPRALGNRSILASPRSKEMQKQLNLKIKYRESFRPFAPVVLEEHLTEWFDLEGIYPYMLVVGEVQKNKRINVPAVTDQLFGLELLNVQRSLIPAVTHVDYTARVQTVSNKTNLRLHQLISYFHKSTDVPLLVNTSFNVRGEPIVNSPTDAFRCFMGTELDVLVIGNYYLLKEKQNVSVIADYKTQFKND
jgi:carbamoyltransferase